jgi:predicted nucleic acid-binding protein
MMPPHPLPEHERICVDASLLLHWLLPSERDVHLDQVMAEWLRSGVELIGPVLLYSEVPSVIRLRVSTGKLTEDEGEVAFNLFNSLRVARVDRGDLHLRAWELTKRYNRPCTYDMTYLTLAELEDLPFWTGDERLINAIGGRDPRVHWVPATSGA